MTNLTKGELQASQLVDENFRNLVDKASVHSVYGKPIQVGDALIIPAAEVISAGGFGFGGGDSIPDEEEAEDQSQGSGSGGGGGAYSFSRPVAMVIINQDGVQIQQVVDTTKIALAAITAIGFMASTMASIYKMKQKFSK